MKRRHFLAVILIAQLSAASFAQQPRTPITEPPPPPAQQPKIQQQKPGDVDVVRITTNLVQVDAVVTDKGGKVVTDLKPEEVQIFEDGKLQKITHFSYNVTGTAVVAPPAKPANVDKKAPPAPPVALKPEQVRRTMAIVVDDLGLSFESTYYVRRALKKFVDEQMEPGDLVAIIRTSGGMGALQQCANAPANSAPGQSQEGVEQGNAEASPAVRHFSHGMLRVYNFMIFNAHLDKATNAPQLTTQVRMFRDGKPVFTGKENPLKLASHNDLKRLLAGGVIQLGPDLPPGEYVLQVIVNDPLASEKHRIASQWIDFEIVK